MIAQVLRICLRWGGKEARNREIDKQARRRERSREREREEGGGSRSIPGVSIGAVAVAVTGLFMYRIYRQVRGVPGCEASGHRADVLGTLVDLRLVGDVLRKRRLSGFRNHLESLGITPPYLTFRNEPPETACGTYQGLRMILHGLKPGTVRETACYTGVVAK